MGKVQYIKKNSCVFTVHLVLS